MAQLVLLAGTSAVILFLASGHIGLHILATAEETFATNPDEAIATILLRTVTIALFEAAAFAVGWYALLVRTVAIQQDLFPRLLPLLGILYAVAALDRQGGEHVMKILKAELRVAMGQIGCPTLKALPSFLAYQ